MNLLAIDSSGLAATVALLSDDILVGEYTIHNKKTHSQTLLPMIHDMLTMADIPVDSLDAVAVSAGPGSFTGLRIGASTAKGLAQALQIPVVSVPSLEGLAWNLAGNQAYICPLMDARRQQVYYGIYDVSGEMPVALVEQAAAPIEEALSQVDRLGHPVIFIGDGVPVFRSFFDGVSVPWSVGSDAAISAPLRLPVSEENILTGERRWRQQNLPQSICVYRRRSASGWSGKNSPDKVNITCGKIKSPLL